MHVATDKLLQRLHLTRGVRRGVIAPRGGAKTTRVTKGYSLFCVCENLERFIAVVKDTHTQAVEDVVAIRDEIESNESIEERYPHVFGRGPVWRDDRIETKNGVCIQAFGSGSKIRGRTFNEYRPTLIIIDDLENDDNVLTDKQRNRTWNWLMRAALPAGNKDTNVLYAGTALHRSDALQRLKATPGWLVETFPSIIRWPDNMKLWQKWETIYNDVLNPDRVDDALFFFQKNKDSMLSGSQVIWEANESLYDLMCLRATIGDPAFESEKQGKPTSTLANEWPDDYFTDDIWFDQWPKFLQVRVMSLDPSKGATEHSDYSAIIKLGKLNDICYVEADIVRRDATRIAEDYCDHYLQFKPQAAGVESNGFQELMKGELDREAAKRKVPEIPLWMVYNHLSKKVRIRSLTPFLKQKRFKFKANSPGTKLLIDQLREFPSGDHDDGPDALEMATRLMLHLLSGENDITSHLEKIDV